MAQLQPYMGTAQYWKLLSLRHHLRWIRGHGKFSPRLLSRPCITKCVAGDLTTIVVRQLGPLADGSATAPAVIAFFWRSTHACTWDLCL